MLISLAYESFAKLNNIPWVRPKYKQSRKYPFIPYESEIDTLIAGCGRKTATLLQLLKETAMRLGEAWKLNWTDINLKNKVVTLNDPEKNSNPRIFRISTNLLAMLNNLKRRNQYVFGKVNVHHASKTR